LKSPFVFLSIMRTQNFWAKYLYFGQPFHSKDVYSEDEYAMQTTDGLTNKTSKNSEPLLLDERTTLVKEK